MEREKMAKLGFLFVVSYALLYFIGLFLPQLHNWNFTGNFAQMDYMFFLLPIVGFFSGYFLVEWVNKYYETNFGSTIGFPILVLALAIPAYYVQLQWYFNNIINLTDAYIKVALYIGAQPAADPGVMFIDFSQMLLDSVFLPFTLAIILGWVAYIILNREEPEKSKG